MIIACLSRMSRLRIHFHFFQNFLIPSTAINLISGFLIHQSGSLSYASVFVLIKIILNVLLGTLFHLTRGDSLYYYNNLGLSVISIYANAMTLDLFVWLCIVILLNLA